MKKTIFVLLAAFFALSPFHFRSAHADATRFSVVTFHPAPDGGEYFTIESSTSLYKLQWTAGTMFDFGYKPLVESGRNIIEYLFIEHFYGALGVTDWLSVGVDLPMAWDNYFSNPDVATAPQRNEWGLSDPRFQVKARLLDRARYPIGIAITPFITVPGGKKSYFLGNDGVTGGGILTFDAEFNRRLWFALNVGLSVHKYVTWRNVDSNATTLLAGLGAFVRATDAFSAGVELKTATATNHFFTQREESPTELLGGVKYNIGKTGLQINAGAGAGLVRGAGTPTVRGFAGLTYRSSNERVVTLDQEKVEHKYYELKKDEQRELEKIVTLKDTCPEDPEDFVKGTDDEGCPKYYEMREVADLISVCPTRPEDYDPSRHSESCNKVFTLTDKFGKTDAEVIYIMSTVDMSEKCPVSPDKFNPKLDDPGCPKYYELKEVVPLIASCPTSVKQFRPGVDDEGCPKVYEMHDAYQEENWMTIARLAKKDTDNDGVADVDDQCPAIFGPVKTGGCPVPEHVVAKLASPEFVGEGFHPLPKLGSPQRGSPTNLAEQAPPPPAPPAPAAEKAIVAEPFLPAPATEKAVVVETVVVPVAPAKELTYGKSAFVEAITKKAPVEPAVAAKPTVVTEPSAAPAVVAAQEVPVKPIKSKVRIRGGEVITSVPITFKFNSFVITDESAVALGELADKIITNPKYGKVRIEGYSDHVGGKVLNKIMSQRRAEAVRNYLELHGADTSNMKIEALGRSREFPGGREANRRVIFIIER